MKIILVVPFDKKNTPKALRDLKKILEQYSN